MRVRLARIEDVDLSIFDFDLDLTFVVFFMNADEAIYGRYGGRDGKSPDDRQSLAGLRHAMEGALELHRAGTIPPALQERDTPLVIGEHPEAAIHAVCVHCHQAKEILEEDLRNGGKWTRDMAWRYPFPDNLGIRLEVDRGNVVESVPLRSPAADAGIQKGDVLKSLGDYPVRSFGDAQFALDRAPKQGEYAVAWRRGEKEFTATLKLPEGWRETDISWRPSMQGMVVMETVTGQDLTAKEKRKLGLSPKQLAFRQSSPAATVVKAAGIQGGDVVLGFDGKKFEMDGDAFHRYTRRAYLKGDRVKVDILRKGQRLSIPMTFN